MTLVVGATAPTDPGSVDARKTRTGENYPSIPSIRVIRPGPVAGYCQTSNNGYGSLVAYPHRADVMIGTSSTRAGRRRANAAMRVVVPKLDGPSSG